MQSLLKQACQQEDFYQKISRLFGHPGITLFRGRELSEVIRYFDRYPLFPEKRVLDLGCGEGKVAKLLFNKLDVGLDLNFNELKRAKSEGVHKNLLFASATSMPFKDGAFDVVFSNSVIEHIKGVKQVLSEVSRVLADDGLFIFTVPSHKFPDYLYLSAVLRRPGLGLLRLDKMYAFFRNKQLSHYNLFSDTAWEKMLNDVSLRIVYKKYYLSAQDIYLWDKLCLFLRMSNFLPFLHKILLVKFNKRVREQIRQEESLNLGAGLLVVAGKKR